MRAWTCMAAALGALTACSQGGEANDPTVNQANSVEQPANTAAADKPAAADSSGPSANASSSASEIRSLLTGRWAEDGNCAAATDIRADGSFASAATGDGRWELSNEYLTLAGSRATVELAVQEIDQREMTTINPEGHIGHWTRC